MKFLNRLYYILLFLLSFAIIGGTTILTADMGIGVLKDPTFYFTQLLTYVAIILVTLGTVFTVIDNFKEKDVEYLETDKFIADFAKDKRNIPSFISKYLEDTNRKRKILQYKFNIRRKLHALIDYRPWYTLKKKYTDEDVHIWNYGTKEEKEKNEYCHKRFLLEEQLTEDFIERNIDKLDIKYKQVTESVILGGYYTDIEKQGPNDFIETSLTWKIIKSKIPKLMLSFGITFMMSVIVFDSISFDPTAIINLCVKMGTLIWNTYLALRYGKELCQTTILHDIRLRKGYITEYDKWLIQQAEQVKEDIADADNGRTSNTDRLIDSRNPNATDNLQPVANNPEIHSDSIHTG